ncbi:MAG: type II toxin-antitoxin system VapC family toxin [Candidatus Odinarchaeota archaeon]|nr:type II toxin-antitoxin system VapC family toxin [Candidatus Odinarchaeota archaeon]
MESKEREIIIDTDVFIFLQKENLLLKFLEAYDGYMTEISLYEFLRGTAYYGKDTRREKALIEEIFTILSLDNIAILKASEIWSILIKDGEIISDRDIFNSAIAICRNLPFVTNNTRHYKRVQRFGLKLIPWKQLKKELLKLHPI